MIVATKPNITLFKMAGNIVALSDYYAAETLTIKRCGLSGAPLTGSPILPLAGTIMVDTQAYPATNFEYGLLLVEDSLIQYFGDTALKIGASIYFNRIHRNQFVANNQAIYLDNNTESSITENNFFQAPAPQGGPTVTSIGPMHRIVHNYFYRYAIGDKSNAPDILLEPEAAWSGQSGGYVWIEDNRFGGELENLDSTRRRIKLAAPDRTIVAGTAIVRGNQFLGPAMSGTITTSGTTATMTLDASQAFVTQGLVANISRVTIYGASNYLLNGTFVVASLIAPPPNTPALQFTYVLPTVTSATNVVAYVRLADAAAIELDNPHLAWDVQGNFFANYGVLIDDNQCPPPGKPQNGGAGWGESLFADNRVLCPQGGYKVFANEGNNFTWIRPPANSALKPVDAWPRQMENLSLRNRVTQSERLDLWTPVNGLTVNPSQIDPFGTHRAYQLTLNGSLPDQHLGSASIDLSGILSTSRLVIKFWAKQGAPASLALTSLMVGLFDVDQQALGGWFGNLFSVSLGPDWKHYKLVTNQLYSLADSFQLLVYPGDTSFTAGNLCLFAPQVSDDDSDYLPTGANVISDASAGSRFEKAVILTSLKTTTHTGDPSSAPVVTATGLGAGSVKLQAGSTDLSGVVLLSPGLGANTLGSVTLTYNLPYVGSNAPVVVVSLQDVSSSAWTPGTSQVRVTSSSLNSCILAWVNGSALSPKDTYAIAYVVIGRA
jgi:hypothetical protein